MEITTLLTGALGGVLIKGAFDIFLKQQEYKNSYHKMVLDKRLAAYEVINTLLGTLKISIFGNEDERTYHNIFHDQSVFVEFLVPLSKTMEHELWLSDETKNRLHNLRKKILYCADQSQTRSLIDIGKENYQQIGILRDQLERSFIRDLSNLYEIDKFLKTKTVSTEFQNKDDYFKNEGSI